jgi:hypothetical protein
MFQGISTLYFIITMFINVIHCDVENQNKLNEQVLKACMNENYQSDIFHEWGA